jgi:uncharacterized membrane protein required for colicin V production
MDVTIPGGFLAAAAVPPAGLPIAPPVGSFGWFDLAVMAMLVAGFFRGRKRGMSVEFMDVLQWLAIIGGGAAIYQPVGSFVALTSGAGKLFSYLISYLLVAIMVKTLCTIFKRSVGDKLVSSEIFGNLEYYLGMAAGMVRYLCMVLFFLALLNARLYTDEEMRAEDLMQKKNFEDIRFPTLGSLQRSVFKGSFTGHFAKQNAPFLLIEGTPPAAPLGSIKQQKDKEFNRSLGL